MTRSMYTNERNLAYSIAYLSNIAHMGAICGYMDMFGLWRSPKQEGADVFY